MVWGAPGMVSGVADAVGKSYRYIQSSTHVAHPIKPDSIHHMYCLMLLGGPHGLMIMKVHGLFLGGGRAGARRGAERVGTWHNTQIWLPVLDWGIEFGSLLIDSYGQGMG